MGLTSPSILLSVAAFSALMLGSGLRGVPHRTPQPTPMRSDHSPLALLFYLPQGSDSWQNSGWTGAGGACQASRGRGPSWTLRQHSWGHHFHQDPSACRCLPCTQLFPAQSLAELSAHPAPGTQSPSSSWQSKYGPGQEEVPPPSRSSLVNRVRVTSQALGRRPGEPRSVAHGSTYVLLVDSLSQCGADLFPPEPECPFSGGRLQQSQSPTLLPAGSGKPASPQGMGIKTPTCSGSWT